VVPNQRIPLPQRDANAPAFDRDSAVQSSAPSMMAPAIGKSFDGVGVPNYSVQYAPPDTNGDVGLTQYVQIVNVDFAVFDKTTGNMVSGFPKASNTIWSGL